MRGSSGCECVLRRAGVQPTTDGFQRGTALHPGGAEHGRSGHRVRVGLGEAGGVVVDKGVADLGFENQGENSSAGRAAPAIKPKIAKLSTKFTPRKSARKRVAKTREASKIATKHKQSSGVCAI